MVRIVMIVCPAFDILCRKYIAKRRGNTILRLRPISIMDYCNESGDKITIIEDEKVRTVYQPKYIPKGNARNYKFKTPAIYIAELEDVSVHGGSGLVIKGNRALTDICANDKENRVKYRFGPIIRGNKKLFYVETSTDSEKLDIAINLCGLAASNYYHLTVEILSRYDYVKKYIGDNSIPVLLDESARKFSQYIELINTVLKDANVIFIPEYKRISCRHLIQPSMNTWMPMNVRRKNDFRIADNLVAKSAVENIQRAAKDYIKPKGERKVFISRRNASFSRIKNEAEVARLFEENGYEIVCTEDLTYKEQVELFSSAACIIGASGAALTNIIYCNPGTVFGCVLPRKYEFCIYSSIAKMVGCKELFLDAKVYRYRIAISIEQCVVDMGLCKEYLDEIEKLVG